MTQIQLKQSTGAVELISHLSQVVAISTHWYGVKRKDKVVSFFWAIFTCNTYSI